MKDYTRSTLTIAKMTKEQNDKIKRAYRVWRAITGKHLTVREWKLFIVERACDGILSVTEEGKREEGNYFFT